MHASFLFFALRTSYAEYLVTTSFHSLQMQFLRTSNALQTSFAGTCLFSIVEQRLTKLWQPSNRVVWNVLLIDHSPGGYANLCCWHSITACVKQTELPTRRLSVLAPRDSELNAIRWRHCDGIWNDSLGQNCSLQKFALFCCNKLFRIFLFLLSVSLYS